MHFYKKNYCFSWTINHISFTTDMLHVFLWQFSTNFTHTPTIKHFHATIITTEPKKKHFKTRKRQEIMNGLPRAHQHEISDEECECPDDRDDRVQHNNDTKCVKYFDGGEQEQ